MKKIISLLLLVLMLISVLPLTALADVDAYWQIDEGDFDWDESVGTLSDLGTNVLSSNTLFINENTVISGAKFGIEAYLSSDSDITIYLNNKDLNISASNFGFGGGTVYSKGLIHLAGNGTLTIQMSSKTNIGVGYPAYCFFGSEGVFLAIDSANYSIEGTGLLYGNKINSTATITDYFLTENTFFIFSYNNDTIKIRLGDAVNNAVDNSPKEAPLDKPIPTIYVGEERPEIKIDVDNAIYKCGDKTLSAKAPIIIENGRTYLGLRDIAYSLGIDPMAVKWNENTKTASISKSGAKIELTEGSDDMVITYGGYIYHKKIDSPAFIRDGRTYVPFRAIFQRFGYTVNWDSETRTIICK